MANILDLLLSIGKKKPELVSKDVVNDPQSLTPEDIQSLKRIGGTYDQISKILSEQLQVATERQTIYRDVSGCFSGDTKIALIDGRDISILEAVQEYQSGKINYVYAVDLERKRIMRSPIKNAMMTGIKTTIEVVLDNGEVITCTPDHRFMLRNGEYKEAKDLISGESLMPLYRGVNTTYRKGYQMVYSPFDGKNKVQYRYFNTGNVPKHFIVHHKDMNKLNDNPENHVIMSREAHASLHQHLAQKASLSPEAQLKKKKSLRTFWDGLSRKERLERTEHLQTPDVRKKNGVAYTTWWANLDVVARKSYCQIIKEAQKRFREDKPEQYVAWKKKIGERNKGRRPSWTGATKDTNPIIARIAESLTGRKRPETDTEVRLITYFMNRYHVTAEEARARYLNMRNKRISVLASRQSECIHCGQMNPKRVTKYCSRKCYFEHRQESRNIVMLNHKVSEVRHTNKVMPVYDLQIDPQHNFALSAGVFVHNSLMHWMIGGAMELFANSSTTPSPFTGKTLWVISDNKKYQNLLNSWIEKMGIEEKLFDWAYTTASYGDMFVGMNGTPGVGVTSIDDSEHPSSVSRLDFNGQLIGFFNTPNVLNNMGLSANPADTHKILPPWTFCFRANTKVRLLDGTIPTIKEMADHAENYVGKYVWSVNPDTLALEADKILEVKKTRSDAEFVRVHLDNDQHVDCTPDHRFMMRDGSFKSAEELQPQDSLMPLYTKKSVQGLKGYTQVYNPKTKKYCYEHRLVGGYVPRGNVIHHKDYNKLNNDPSNLQVMSVQEHFDLHHAFSALCHDKDVCKCFCCVAWRRRAVVEERSCLECGSKFSIKAWSKKFLCSLVCGVLYRAKKKTKPTFERFCACGCGQSFTVYTNRKKTATRQYISGHQFKHNDYHGYAGHDKTTCTCSVCKVSRNESLECGWSVRKDRVCKHCKKLFKDCSISELANHAQHCESRLAVLNHKVIRVEQLNIREDAYDLMTEKNHNFPLDAGVFVHNCHFRILGANRSRAAGDLPGFTFSTQSLMSNDPQHRKLTSNYGTSLIYNSLAPYKRLKLAEDSLLMARMSRGIMRYIWKFAVPNDTSSMEAVSALSDEYKALLKRARSINTGNPANFQDQFSTLGVQEDILVPVFGEVNNLTVDKIGGDVDVKWIVDIEELRNQLASSLGTPLQLLGGFTGELSSGGLGGKSLESYDVRFARRVRRIQKALIVGVTRMCQIHLAFQGMDPDPMLFQVMMNETSTAEEAQIADSLDKGSDTVKKMMELMGDTFGEKFDKVKFMNYMNKKILCLEDLDMKDYVLATEDIPEAPKEKEGEAIGNEVPENPEAENAGEVPAETPEPITASRWRSTIKGTDADAMLPVKTDTLVEGKTVPVFKNSKWETLYGGIVIQSVEEKAKKK